MRKSDRLKYILEEIRTYNQVKSVDLSHELKVSEDTIRRDLKELSKKGKIRKIHGGAMASDFIPLSHKEREIYKHDEKVAIVRKARKLLKSGMIIAMDGGTTNLEMARLLPHDLKITVITNSLPIAQQLTDHKNIEILFFGGRILKDAQVSIGQEVIKALQEVKTDMCFLGTRSLDFEIGMTDINYEEVQVKKALIENTARAVCLTLSEKLNTSQPYRICDIVQIDSIVTELDPNSSLFKEYTKKGLDIL